MKTGYLAYAVYNLDDGGDFYPLGVYGDRDTAIDMLVAEMESYGDDDFNAVKVYNMFHENNVVYNDYDKKFAYAEIKVEL